MGWILEERLLYILGGVEIREHNQDIVFQVSAETFIHCNSIWSGVVGQSPN